MFYGWWIVIMLFLGSAFAGATVWYGFTAYFEPLIKEFGWSYVSISFAASLRGVETGLLDVFFGFLVDRIGGRRIILFSSVLLGLGFLLLNRINSLAVFYISFFVVALGSSGFATVVYSAIISRWFRKRLGLAIGISTAGFGASGFALPGIVYMLDVLGFRTVFFIYGVAAIVLGAIVTYVVRSGPEDMGKQPYGTLQSVRLSQDEASSELRKGIANHPHVRELHLRGILSQRPFWMITYLNIASTFTVQIVTTHVMPYLGDLGYSRYFASLIAMFIPTLSVAGRVIIGSVSDNINSKRMLTFMVIAEIFAVALFSIARPSFLLGPFVIIFGISYGGLLVIRTVILRDYYGVERIGVLMGLCLGIGTIGSIIGPTLAGWIFDVTGSYNIAWLICSVLLALGIPLVLSTRNPPA